MITPLGLSLEDIFIQLTSKQDEVQRLQGETDDSHADSQPSVEVIETEEGGNE